jgi:hypothetical protein
MGDCKLHGVDHGSWMWHCARRGRHMARAVVVEEGGGQPVGRWISSDVSLAVARSAVRRVRVTVPQSRV